MLLGSVYTVQSNLSQRNWKRTGFLAASHKGSFLPGHRYSAWRTAHAWLCSSRFNWYVKVLESAERDRVTIDARYTGIISPSRVIADRASLLIRNGNPRNVKCVNVDIHELLARLDSVDDRTAYQLADEAWLSACTRNCCFLSSRLPLASQFSFHLGENRVPCKHSVRTSFLASFSSMVPFHRV